MLRSFDEILYVILSGWIKSHILFHYMLFEARSTSGDKEFHKSLKILFVFLGFCFIMKEKRHSVFKGGEAAAWGRQDAMQAIGTTIPQALTASAQAGAVHLKTQASPMRAELSLEKITPATAEKASLYAPAQKQLSFLKKGSEKQDANNLSPMKMLLLWEEAASRVATGNTTQSKSALPSQTATRSVRADSRPEDGAQQEGKAAVKPNTGCTTCESRVYQDQSSDAGVSFQSPKGLPASTAALSVVSHEGEHATRETARAQENGEVITNKTVTLQMGCCPECHKMYVKGGTTSITKAAKKAPEDAVVSKAADAAGVAGEKVNMEL